MRLAKQLWSKKIDKTNRVQILDKPACVSHFANALGKGMNPSLFIPSMGNYSALCPWYEQSDDQSIDIMVRAFVSGPGDQSSIPGRVIPKTQKMVLAASLKL